MQLSLFPSVATVGSAWETPEELCTLTSKKTSTEERGGRSQKKKMENGAWKPLLPHKCSSCHALYRHKSITIYCLSYWDACFSFVHCVHILALLFVMLLCWTWQFKDRSLWSINHILPYTSKDNCKEWRNLTSEKAACYL